jgi:hypothetical protein
MAIMPTSVWPVTDKSNPRTASAPSSLKGTPASDPAKENKLGLRAPAYFRVIFHCRIPQENLPR